MNEQQKKKSHAVGKYKANDQDKIHNLIEFVVDKIFEITEEELTRLYPAKNWYDDNFGANVFSMALQITAGIQNNVVARRAYEITEGREEK